MDEPRRILVIRLGAIGDIVMASGMITALRSRYPKAHIAWLADSANADLLKHNPRLDAVHLWPRRQLRQLLREGHRLAWWRGISSLVRELRAEKFDLVLEMQGLLKAAVWAKLSGGRFRIGLGSREGTWLWMHKVLSRDNGISPMMSKEYRQLAEFVDCHPEDFKYDLCYSEDDQSQLVQLLDATGVRGKYAVLCPFTTRPQKHWLDDEWIKLGKKLAHDEGLNVLVAGGPAEAEKAAMLVAAMGDGAYSVAGKTSLAICVAMIDHAALTIGVDTGLTHMASALSRPVVVVFGSTLPYTETGSPWTRVLYTPLPCVPCERHPSCDGAYTCMTAHKAESVYATAVELLDAHAAALERGEELR